MAFRRTLADIVRNKMTGASNGSGGSGASCYLVQESIFPVSSGRVQTETYDTEVAAEILKAISGGGTVMFAKGDYYRNISPTGIHIEPLYVDGAYESVNIYLTVYYRDGSGRVYADHYTVSGDCTSEILGYLRKMNLD